MSYCDDKEKARALRYLKPVKKPEKEGISVTTEEKLTHPPQFLVWKNKPILSKGS